MRMLYVCVCECACVYAHAVCECACCMHVCVLQISTRNVVLTLRLLTSRIGLK